jgi:signal transduction histidine kinase
LRAWRTTTAVRVFALALATGTAIGDGTWVESMPVLIVLGTMAAVLSLLEWVTRDRLTRWPLIGEAVSVAALLTSTAAVPGFGAYLAVPSIVAGVRHGLVTSVNVTLLSGLTIAATLAVDPGENALRQGYACLPWLAIGLGVGVLASWQSRATRYLVARQAPHAAAHQLVARLHQLASGGNLGLDSTSLAADLDTTMRAETGAARCAVFLVEGEDRLRPFATQDDSDRLAQEIHASPSDRTPGAAVVPLRGVHQVLGYCVLTGVPRWSPELDERAHEVADEFAVRLDTAVLFDEIRHLATAEERNRIARDMHDGVAQDIVALGYVVDEIESVTQEPVTLELADTLRRETSRIVTELRHSIFDLRLEVTGQDLTTALTNYVQDVSRDTDLRVHLVLDSNRSDLPPRTQGELMRIAQEAIGNVRRHARATNLWITLVSDEGGAHLEVVDDGVGDALPRDRHWGLQTMHERAAGIGAELTIESRPSGGTAVRLIIPSPTTTRGSARHEHHRPAHR